MSLAPFTTLDDPRDVHTGQSMLDIPSEPRNVPTMVSMLTGRRYAKIGISGMGWAELLADSDHMAMLEAYARPEDTLVMNGGQGDALDNALATAASVFDAAVDYSDAARSLGWATIVGVVGPSFGNGVYPISESQIEAWDDGRALLVASPGDWCDVLVRCDTAPFDNPTNVVYFLLDQLHLRQAGGDLMAERIAAAL